MNLDLWQFFDAERSHILTTALRITQDRGWKIYAVGGIVRDGLMAGINGTGFDPTDVDLVVDGGERSGIEVAIALHRIFPQAKLQTYDKFQTALLEWTALKSQSSPKFSLDIATARSEIYAYPGANPQVQASSIDQDLYRRDFTINAFALEVGKTEIINLFDGYSDLINHQIRAIRVGSFAEDPRRIFRAVRFATRFGFTLHPQTAAEIRAVTASGLHDRIGGSRLKAEIHYIFAHPLAVKMLRSLDQLGGLRCIDPELKLPKDFSLHLSRLRKWLRWFKPDLNFPEIAEKLLLSYLEPQKLELLSQKLKSCDLPSAIVKVLRTYQEVELIIFAVTSLKSDRRIIWQYFTQWQRIKPILTGSDLKALGYTEGKIIGNLLTQIRNATLDGKITTKDKALILIKELEISDDNPRN
ncbi:tRNA nucleotidyltransferase/poly(A) polymerase [Synechococcus sp. PCC 7502]|uniref:CCA tRNA nucleotidyltransferase n=1 Tax=Synechococcus sp. PCC 7502 TaxID=1173263 RepID=UPI00029FF60C|nr:CCA tRNA nucleotidyltransferase [Synechococcus sp. PCC 7502]AFY74364.1 tRNA nucleotidyltransferase/poly(A) polymerase [Synechococcus sp. PCC 7502]